MTTIAYPYPSTSQYRNTAKFLQHSCGNDRPVVRYLGTVKMHGTNGSIVKNAEGEIYFQSKNRVLGINNDNSGFMEHMINFLPQIEHLFNGLEAHYKVLHGVDAPFPIEIAGEWAGKGIQKNVAISEVDKFFSIFGIRFGDEKDSGGRNIGWEPIMKYDYKYSKGVPLSIPEARIFSVLIFKHWVIDIPVISPEFSSNDLGEITKMVEKECPVGKYFGISGVGEGVVWVPVEEDLVTNPQSWFKVKGQKHSVSKVKTLAPVDVEKLNSIKEFVEYAVTENRLEQGVQEVGLDIKNTGNFIGWVSRDINKEEQDTLAGNGLTMKQVGKYVAQKARAYFIEKCNY